MSRIRVIGVGNPDRGDDGAGPAVIAALRTCAPALPEAVVLGTTRGDMLALLDQWCGDDQVFLIDAMAPGEHPGSIMRIDATGELEAAPLAAFASSHAFDLPQALALARTLDRLPGKLVIYGIEAASFGHGVALSAHVAAAIPQVTEHIRKECDACMKPR